MSKSNNLIRVTTNGIVPNIIRGGVGMNIGDNMFLMKGKTHDNGGIDIGKSLEVENNEIVQINPNNVKVFSARPFLGGYSPSQLVLNGNNPEQVFALQEKYKPKDNKENKADLGGFFRNLFGINKKEENNDNDNNKKEEKEPESIDFEELAVKQAYKESSFNSNAKSNKNAVGLFQIRPITVKDFNRLTGKNYTIDDMNDHEKNYEVRNTIMNWLSERPYINKAGLSDSLIAGRTLAAYNMGAENFRQTLNKAAAEGNDISDWNFLNYVGGEPKDYVNFILRNKDINQYYNNDEYQKAIVKFKDVVDFVKQNNGYNISTKQNKEQKNMAYGGLSPLSQGQLIIYNPFSTGKSQQAVTIGNNQKRTKAQWGALEWNTLGGGLASLAGNLLSGIGGSIIGKKIRNMYDNMKRTSSYVPITREHISTNVDVNPQLDAVRNAQAQADRMIDVNTNSSKAAINRKRSVGMNSLAQMNAVYSDKLNRETQLRNAEAELQTKYNMIDNQNKINDINAQNDFEMQRQVGKINASNQEAATWIQGVQNMIGDANSLLTNYNRGLLQLAGSQNKDLSNPAIIKLGLTQDANIQQLVNRLDRGNLDDYIYNSGNINQKNNRILNILRQQYGLTPNNIYSKYFNN